MRHDGVRDRFRNALGSEITKKARGADAESVNKRWMSLFRRGMERSLETRFLTVWFRVREFICAHWPTNTTSSGRIDARLHREFENPRQKRAGRKTHSFFRPTPRGPADKGHRPPGGREKFRDRKVKPRNCRQIGRAFCRPSPELGNEEMVMPFLPLDELPVRHRRRTTMQPPSLPALCARPVRHHPELIEQRQGRKISIVFDPPSFFLFAITRGPGSDGGNDFPSGYWLHHETVSSLPLKRREEENLRALCHGEKWRDELAEMLKQQAEILPREQSGNCSKNAGRMSAPCGRDRKSRATLVRYRAASPAAWWKSSPLDLGLKDVYENPSRPSGKTSRAIAVYKFDRSAGGGF